MGRIKMAAVAGVVVVLIGLGSLATGLPQRILLGQADLPSPAKTGVEKPAAGQFPHHLLGGVQQRHVDAQGQVDYVGMAKDKALKQYLEALARWSPASHPALFPTRQDQLTYYINAYNALVFWGVIQHWPIKSVQDVQFESLIKLKDGQGFFYSLRFELGGQWINLYDLENTIIRGYGDARIHAAINCASKGCPKLATFAFTPDQLDQQLTLVMEVMVNEPRNVRVNTDQGTIEASSIFDWFRSDFEAEAPSLPQYWLKYAKPPLRAQLQAAQTHPIAFVPYDWGINAQPSP